ncbi:MAG: hypothetical protein AAGG08_14985 [Actinomycetota bacterium]
MAATVALSGCFTGERPSFDEPPESVSTGNAAIDAVLQRLESVDRSQFTASFQIDTKFGTLRSAADVAQSAGRRLSVTIRNDDLQTRFVVDGTDERTCDLVADECETGLNDARISNTQLSHRFYAPSFATRLRVSADRRIGDVIVSTTTIGGQPAECVDVPVAGGVETFCALESGVLAMFVGADVTIELTAYSPTPDESLFET